MQRRYFLKLAGCFSIAINAPLSLSGCGSKQSNPVKGELAFLHGVASGDPRESSVMLWTRITPLEDSSGYVDVRVQCSLDETFQSLLVNSSVRIDESSDYTLRFLLQELSSDTVYFYRFVVNETLESPIGRTWTAPSPESEIDIHFASVNCQNREHGFYAAYAHLLNEDLAKPNNQQIRFVLHLGDFIYETRNDGLQFPTDVNGNRSEPLQDRFGEARDISPFSEGGLLADDTQYAVTLADYRHLYKTYLLDPDLQAARARWPFIYVWDDHEFTDDYWQSEANYDDTGIGSSINEPSQPRKLAANQAWYEYIPVDFRENSQLDSVSHYAKAFTAQNVGVSTNDEYDDDGLATNRDNLAAIHSLIIYRSLRFGKNLQLVLTDCRSFRSDHAIPEDISGNFQGFVHARIALPISLINTLDAGREANAGNPPEILDLPPVNNPRIDRAPGTMLGKQQKQWWKEVMQNSTAQWKIWSNSVPVMRMGIDLSSLSLEIDDIVLSADTWDGYNSERRELVSYLFENNIANVVSIAGDVHAFYAGNVLAEYDGVENSQPSTLPEFVCGAVSSITQFAALERLSYRENPTEMESILRQLITYSAQNTNELVCNFNTTMQYGSVAAIGAARQAADSIVLPDTPSPINPHLNYVDTSVQGYSLVRVSSDNLEVEYIALPRALDDPQLIPASVLRRVKFNVPAREDVGKQIVEGPIITGETPFPL